MSIRYLRMSIKYPRMSIKYPRMSIKYPRISHDLLHAIILIFPSSHLTTVSETADKLTKYTSTWFLITIKFKRKKKVTNSWN